MIWPINIEIITYLAFSCISIFIYSIFVYYIYIWPTSWPRSNFIYLNLILRIKSNIWSKKIKFDPRIKIWSAGSNLIWSCKFDPKKSNLILGSKFDPKRSNLIWSCDFDPADQIWFFGSNLIWSWFDLILNNGTGPKYWVWASPSR